MMIVPSVEVELSDPYPPPIPAAYTLKSSVPVFSFACEIAVILPLSIIIVPKLGSTPSPPIPAPCVILLALPLQSEPASKLLSSVSGPFNINVAPGFTLIPARWLELQSLFVPFQINVTIVPLLISIAQLPALLLSTSESWPPVCVSLFKRTSMSTLFRVIVISPKSFAMMIWSFDFL